uniref:Uncharacterized protein n=1 Tax=Physcomitrium patens TaxID=3218 RepID=A0A2K1KLZ3_PHYPA|nr:hypothetical protein PHYPA_005677 [Physcomitrium patens]
MVRAHDQSASRKTSMAWSRQRNKLGYCSTDANVFSHSDFLRAVDFAISTPLKADILEN